MNARRWLTFISGCALLLAALAAHASGAVGVYGLIERVTFEPNADAPERVRVYGAFTLYDRMRETQAAAGTARGAGAVIPGGTTPVTSGAERGYLYFALPYPDTEHAAARREWADLAAIAGTGEAVAFASYGFIGAFSGARARAAAEVLVAIPPAEYPPQVRELRDTVGASFVFAGSAILQVWPEAASDAVPVRYSTAGLGVVRLGKGNHDGLVAEPRSLLER